MSKIDVAILEDHLGIVDSYRQRLGTDADINLVAIARYGEELERLLQDHPVDVLILDLEVRVSATNDNSYPVLLLIPKFLEHYPGLTVIVISGHCRRVLVKRAMDAGVMGYIVKEDWDAVEQLPTIVKLTNGGSAFISRLAKQHLDEGGPSSVHLTDRELEALALCAAYPEETTKHLAGRMHISNSTLRSLLSGVYEKLGVNSRAAAILTAQSQGILVTATTIED